MREFVRLQDWRLNVDACIKINDSFRECVCDRVMLCFKIKVDVPVLLGGPTTRRDRALRASVGKGTQTPKKHAQNEAYTVKTKRQLNYL